jgi:hypothetical protein
MSLCRVLGAMALLALLGCGSYANIDRDFEDRPVTNTGVAATILMPGDNGVPMPATNTYGGLGPPPAPGPGASSGSSSASGAGTPSGGGMTMIGGTTQEIEQHQKVNNEPAWAKVLKLPFAVAAYPFKKAHQAVTGPPDPTVKVSGPPPQAPPTPAELQAQHERALLEGMDRELAGQGSAPAPSLAPAPAPYATPAPSVVPAPAPRMVASAPAGGGTSIAAELAALRRAMAAPAGAPQAAATPGTVAAPQAAEPPREELYESVDRDADGRPDHWVYRQGGTPVAETFDDDGDGRPERRVELVPGTRTPVREEDDTNGDGRPDTFTEYEGGAVARRRADSDGDGEVDAWSYEQERMASQEEDTNGDDVMDLRSFYQEGKLRRREMMR